MYQGNAYNFAAVVPAVIDAGLANSLATFQAPSGVLTSSGAPDGVYNDVSGYVAILCKDAPTSNLRITAGERKSLEDIESSNSDHVWLAGFYPAIASHTDWRVTITDPAGNLTTWDVLGAESDSEAQTTRVKIQQASI